MDNIWMRFRICRQFRDGAGIGLESVGLYLHAPSADEAVATARRLMPWLPAKLVAVPEAA